MNSGRAHWCSLLSEFGSVISDFLPSPLFWSQMISSLHTIFTKSALVCEWKPTEFVFYLPGSFHFVCCLSDTSMFLQMARFESILWLNHKTWLIEIWHLQVTLKLGQHVLCPRACVLVVISLVTLPVFGGSLVVAILNLFLERKFCHWRPGLSPVNDWTGSWFAYPQLLHLLFPSPVTSAPVFYRTVKFYLLIHTILTSPLQVEGTDLS